MAIYDILPAYHRKLSMDQEDEIELARNSKEVWGKEPKHLATGGPCVQAYPGHLRAGQLGYSFGSDVPTKISYGFKDGKKVVREVYWFEEMDGVETRITDDHYACIKITWFQGPH